MMKYFIFLSTLLFLGCYKIERSCKDYKTGSYYCEIAIGDKTYTSSFVRTSNLQIETYNNKTDSSYVRWVNDCEMIFKTINPKNRSERKDVHLKILTTTDSTYTFEYSYVGETKKQKGIAIRRK